MKNIVKVNDNIYNNVHNVSNINGRIFIDGKDVTPNSLNVVITVTGNVGVLNVGSGSADIQGNVTSSLSLGSGDAVIGGNVTGTIKIGSGDLEVSGTLVGDVSTGSGDVKCKSIQGNVSTKSGDIN